MGKIKSFNVKMPFELWSFLKRLSVLQDTTMNMMIVESIEKQKKKMEEKNKKVAKKSRKKKSDYIF